MGDTTLAGTGGGAHAVEARITQAAAWLKMRDFDPTMALELRLTAAEKLA